MPALLHYDPSGATFSPITPVQYTALIAAMKSNSQVTKLTDNSCTVQGIVDFGWVYDGSNSLHVNIAAKHGKAHFAPNATIFDELDKQFVSLV